MKKNWVVFILICAAAWLWMVSKQITEQRRYEKEVAAWKVQQAEYEAAKQEAEQERLVAKREAAEALAKLEAATGATTQTLTVAPADSAVAPDITIRRLKQRLYTPITAPRVEVETDLYRVVLTELGARPIQWEIKTSRFVTNVKDGSTSATVQMIPQVDLDNPDREFPLGLVGNTARDFNAELFSHEVIRTDEGTRVVFTSAPLADIDIACVKEYFFRNDSFAADLTVTYKNGPKTVKLLGGRIGHGIGWQGGFGDPEITDRVHGTISVVYGLNDSILTRFISNDENKLDLEAAVDWIGQEKKYFTALLIPSAENKTALVRASIDRSNNGAIYKAKGVSPPLSVEALHEPVELLENQSFTLKYQLYVGPKHREALSTEAIKTAPESLSPSTVVFHTVPLGMTFLRPVALLLLGLMRFLHEFLASWGLAIIGTTICVRILIYPLTHWAINAQARTMIEQQRIRPEMEQINKRFANDPMKRNQAIMQLYRDHNVNPLGMLRGCFPILLQAPIFMALYVLFEQSVELRGQSFLWIKDLSGPDALYTWGVDLWLVGASFNLLPILMGITNYIQMSIMQMPATDEMQAAIQKQMMVMMPIMFTFFLYQLPAGLVLYWIVSNIISIGQSVLTKRIIAQRMAAHEATKTA